MCVEPRLHRPACVLRVTYRLSSRSHGCIDRTEKLKDYQAQLTSHVILISYTLCGSDSQHGAGIDRKPNQLAGFWPMPVLCVHS